MLPDWAVTELEKRIREHRHDYLYRSQAERTDARSDERFLLAIQQELTAFTTLRAQVEQMTPYLQHRDDCGAWLQLDRSDKMIDPSRKCTCGLAALLVSGRSPGQE